MMGGGFGDTACLVKRLEAVVLFGFVHTFHSWTYLLSINTFLRLDPLS
jgi:hypothetical protein